MDFCPFIAKIYVYLEQITNNTCVPRVNYVV